MKDIYAHIEKYVDDSIELLFELVRQPSVSAQNMGFDKAPQLVKRALESVGLTAEIVPVPNKGKPSVFGWARAGEPPLPRVPSGRERARVRVEAMRRGFSLRSGRHGGKRAETPKLAG